MESAWEVVTSVGTAAGAVAAMIAAIASWRSASSSARTAKDSREALGLGLQPSLGVDMIRMDLGDGVQRLYGRVMPGGPLGAANISATWHLEGGQVVRGRWPELPGWRPDHAPGSENSLRVVLPDDARDRVTLVEVTFSDTRNVCMWHQSWERVVDRADRGTILVGR